MSSRTDRAANDKRSAPIDPESPAPTRAEPLEAPDPFDPANMRLDPAAELVAIERVLVRVRVRKPDSQGFFRVHPDPIYRVDTALILLREEREFYYLDPALRSVLGDEAKPYRLYLAVTQGGAVFLWPVRLPGSDGKDNDWWRTARKAAELGMRSWTRIQASESAGEYKIDHARGVLADPEWPDRAPGELLRLAFQDNYIDNVEHPVVRRLWGQA